MFTDSRLFLADNVDCAESDAASVILPESDVIDTLADPTLKDIGNGTPMYLVLRVPTAWGGASATVTFTLKSDSTDDLATSATSHFSIAVPVPQLTTAFKRAIPLPSDTRYERFVGLWMDVAGDDVTGRLTAFLTSDAAFWDPLPDAI